VWGKERFFARRRGWPGETDPDDQGKLNHRVRSRGAGHVEGRQTPAAGSLLRAKMIVLIGSASAHSEGVERIFELD